jgi:hypothetical protein
MNLSRQISKTASLDDAVLIERILAALEEDRYGIKRLTHNCVEFSDHNGGIRSRSEYFGLLESGEFSIERSNDKNVVKLTYLAIPLSEIVSVAAVFLFFTLFGVIDQVYFCFFISLAFLGQLIFRYFNLKNRAENMLEDITQ